MQVQLRFARETGSCRIYCTYATGSKYPGFITVALVLSRGTATSLAAAIEGPGLVRSQVLLCTALDPARMVHLMAHGCHPLHTGDQAMLVDVLPCYL